MSLTRETLGSSAAPGMDDTEERMRRALGLFGDAPRPRQEGERSEGGGRPGGFPQGGFPQGGFGQGGFGQGGFGQGVHRRRFVQDGEVPVTVVRRDSPDSAAGGSAPTSSRLQRTEAALAAESAARDRAEKSLQETQAALQALRTKIGHNELSKNEAVAAAHRLRDEIVTLKEEIAGNAERLQDLEVRASSAEDDVRALRDDLVEERRARKLAERMLREQTEEPTLVPALVGHDDLEPPRPRRGRPPAVRPEPEPEGEPVKWWLMPAKAAVKRR